MTTALASQPTVGAVEQALIMGDLSGLSGEHKVAYYNRVCASLGLNPMTKPFQYIVLNEKLTLYATKDCTEQLRTIHGISLKIVAREVIENVYIVTTQATRSDGRTDEATGAVPLVKEDGEWTTSQSGKRFFKRNGNFIPLDPEARAHALMRAETKSKRRVTLSICGLGMLDESEVESIPGATIVPTAIDTGNAQIGTQEAADYVAQQKIKQLEEGKSKNFEMLRAFGDLKKCIGNDEYYRILETQGYKHSNEITDAATGREIYRQMKALADAIDARHLADLKVEEARLVAEKKTAGGLRSAAAVLEEDSPLAGPNGGSVTQQHTEPPEERSDANEPTEEEMRAALSEKLKREMEEAARPKFGDKPAAKRRR